MSTGVITTIAGSSTSSSYSGDNVAATSATLYGPAAVALDSSGRLSRFSIIHFHFLMTGLLNVGNVYFADCGNHRIRKVTVSTGIISTIAGTGTSSYSGDMGDATSAALYNPIGVALDSAGTQSFIYSSTHPLLSVTTRERVHRRY